MTQQPSLKERIATDLEKWMAKRLNIVADNGMVDFEHEKIAPKYINEAAQAIIDLCCREFEGAVKRASSLGFSHPHLANYISSSDLLEAIKELRK